MNYRHLYHAGNYADVFKHVLLLQLLRAMQRKEKGFLYLDTHAGRGGYDLSTTTILPDGRERAPEWPAGIGRIWEEKSPPVLFADYLAAVRAYNVRQGAPDTELQHYPGSPWVAQSLLRMQDRAALCELREDDAEALDFALANQPNVSIHPMDGYTALKAMLPPQEKRVLVLLDPPFEKATEFADILGALREALRRFPSGVYAVWYPVTERARSDWFQQDLLSLGLPPTLVAELQIAGDASKVRMKGCGLLILNPPWQIETEIRAVMPVLLERLRLDPGAAVRVRWLVPEK
jgi:23S rRNA (adenine2030-N6)-methyltransferase